MSNDIKMKEIEKECENILSLGSYVYAREWVEINKKSVKYHNEHCNTSKVDGSVYGYAQGHNKDIVKFKRYGAYGDCEVYWYRCGCVEVIHTPIPRRYWFAPDKKSQQERFALVRALIDRNRAVNNMLG